MTGGSLVVLRPGELIVGRGMEADVHLDDPTVSRRHIRLALLDDRLSLVDLESQNGTWVNGARVEMMMLESGDAIRVGCDTVIYLARSTRPAQSD